MYRNFSFNQYQEIKKAPEINKLLPFQNGVFLSNGAWPTAQGPAPNGMTKTEVCWTNNLVYIMKYHSNAH